MKRRRLTQIFQSSTEMAILIAMSLCLVLPYALHLILDQQHQHHTNGNRNTFIRTSSGSDGVGSSVGTTMDEASMYPWNDMDLTQNATCGVDKCFFRSVTDSTLGYLVAGSDRYESMLEASTLAQSIAQEFHAKHLYLELARPINATEAFQARLNRLVYQPNRNLEGWEQEDVFLTDDDLTFVVVQKVRVAPEPSLFLAVTAQNRQVTLQQIDHFRALVPDKAAFARQFSQELQVIRKVLTKYPKLHYDFQGMADVQGNFYFIDMDGQDHLKQKRPKGLIRTIRNTQMAKLRETLKMLMEEKPEEKDEEDDDDNDDDDVNEEGDDDDKGNKGR